MLQKTPSRLVERAWRVWEIELEKKEISFTSSKFINVDMEDMGHSSLRSSQPFIDFLWLLWMQRAIPAC